MIDLNIYMSFIIGFTVVYTHSILSRCHWAKTWFSTIGTTVQLNLFSDTFTFSCKNITFVMVWHPRSPHCQRAPVAIESFPILCPIHLWGWLATPMLPQQLCIERWLPPPRNPPASLTVPRDGVQENNQSDPAASHETRVWFESVVLPEGWKLWADQNIQNRVTSRIGLFVHRNDKQLPRSFPKKMLLLLALTTKQGCERWQKNCHDPALKSPGSILFANRRIYSWYSSQVTGRSDESSSRWYFWTNSSLMSCSSPGVSCFSAWTFVWFRPISENSSTLSSPSPFKSASSNSFRAVSRRLVSRSSTRTSVHWSGCCPARQLHMGRLPMNP